MLVMHRKPIVNRMPCPKAITEYMETEYMETKKALQSAVLPSAPSGTRTLDTLIKSQVLYQLS